MGGETDRQTDRQLGKSELAVRLDDDDDDDVSVNFLWLNML